LCASGVFLGDVTHDGIQDVIAVTALADSGSLVDAGAAYVFRGEHGLTGERSPWATLRDPNETSMSSFGYGFTVLADLDGSGGLDLVIGAQVDPVAGVARAGAVLLWRGGAALQGLPAASRVLTRSAPVASDRLGEGGARLVDFAGTGALTLVVGAPYADVGGVSDAGAVFLWNAPLLTGSLPETTLSIPFAHTQDVLGR
jgi:hypothetical protein